ncbi:hypothetical protein ACFB49_42880 [Sphingomonas sp. DBB INV C78]|uniref:hypothetical protein n=1 Tax=Sphingomonas sp. DBB INV C78 TaxID=3349434 RepID=UPI0036D268F0
MPYEGHALLRLPETAYIVPSKPNPWRAGLPEGAKFTGHQLFWLKRAGIDPEKADSIKVYSPATTREYWWPPKTKGPVFEMDCPVIRRAPDFVYVVTPSGMEKKVNLDGTIPQPPQFKRSRFKFGSR